jgi:orotate phosphoribosyltransferase
MNVLQAFKETGALLEGHFILRSGLHSRQFFQCAILLSHAELASEICEELADKVRGLGVAFDAICSPALGGILVGQELARHLRTRHFFTEKIEGRLALRRFAIPAGIRLLVAEDVVTTGSAVRETMEVMRAKGGVIVGVASLVDRSGGAGVDFGVPYVSLLKLEVETFSAEALPADLAALPGFKPGSL